MSSVMQMNQAVKYEEDGGMALPQGWFITGSQSTTLLYGKEADNYRQSVARNVPLVAKRTELLIEMLDNNLGLEVPISYIRINESTAYHVLLLVDRSDFLSTKMYPARIMTEKFMHKDDAFDIHFQFSIQSENMLVGSVLSQGYKLVHIRDVEYAA